MILAALLGCAWLVLVRSWLPAETWSDGDALALVDHPLMRYLVERGRAFFGLYQRPWGYDPYYSAGYPLTFVWNSNVVLQGLGIALGHWPAAAIEKIFLLLTAVLVPVAMWRAARRLFEDDTVALAAGAIGGLLFLTEAGWFWLYLGMGPGLACLLMMLLTMAAMHRSASTPTLGAALSLALTAGLTVLVHKTGLLMIGILLVAWLLFPPAGRRLAIFRLAFACALGILVLNAFWLLPMLAMLKQKIIWADTLPRKDYSHLLILSDWLTGQLSGGGGASPALMALRWIQMTGAALGIALLHRTRPATARFLLVWIVLLAAYVYWGHLIPPGEHANPYRYLVLLRYLVGLAAACGWVLLLRQAETRFNFPNGLRAAVRIIGALAFAVLLLAVSRFQQASFPLTRESQLAQPAPNAVLQWVSENADRSARILMEQSDVSREGIPNGYDLVAAGLCGDGSRFCASPVYPYLLVNYVPFQLMHGRLNGRPLEDWLAQDAQEWDRRMDRYNVGWILCWSESCRALGDTHPERFRVSEGPGPWRLLQRNADLPGYFAAGSGTLTDAVGRIGATEVQPENGRVVLRFHYVRGMDVVPSGSVRPTNPVEGDLPFIEVLDPPAKFWINY